MARDRLSPSVLQTCGLEMVVSGVRGGEGEERGTLAHLCTGKLWDRFLKKLQENDYFQVFLHFYHPTSWHLLQSAVVKNALAEKDFDYRKERSPHSVPVCVQGEMEGSLKHQELMTSARHYFLSTVAADTQAEENLK